MDDVTVKLASSKDAALVAHQRCAMFLEMGTLARDSAAELREASERYFREAIESGRYLAWFALAGERTIGGGGMQLNTIAPRPGDDGAMMRLGPQGLVMNVYVEPAWRGKGVAELLMRTMIDHARNHQIPSIVLHASTAGRPLYEKLGFASTGEMRLLVS